MCCNCCKPASIEKRLLNDKLIYAEEPHEPGILNWHNYGVSDSTTCQRKFAIFTTMLAIMFSFILSIILLKSWASERLIMVPSMDCLADVSETDAFIDFNMDVTKRSGNLHCFCKDIVDELGFEQTYLYTSSIKGDSDLGDICAKWVWAYRVKLSINYGIGFLIVGVNLFIEWFIKYFKDWRRSENDTAQQIFVISGIAGL